MSRKIDADLTTQDKPLTITRYFAAPRDQVFHAFVDVDVLKQWWGPVGFTCPYFRTDPKVGGTFLGCMKSADGKEFWSTGHYLEVKESERLKYSDSFADSKGAIVPATYYQMSAEFPLECVVELIFSDSGDGTKLVLKHHGIPRSEFNECIAGWGQCLDKLATAVEEPAKDSVSPVRSHSLTRPSV